MTGALSTVLVALTRFLVASTGHRETFSLLFKIEEWSTKRTAQQDMWDRFMLTYQGKVLSKWGIIQCKGKRRAVAADGGFNLIYVNSTQFLKPTWSIPSLGIFPREFGKLPHCHWVHAGFWKALRFFKTTSTKGKQKRKGIKNAHGSMSGCAKHALRIYLLQSPLHTNTRKIEKPISYLSTSLP